MNITRTESMGLDQQHGDQTNDRCIRFISFNRLGAVSNFQAKIDIFSDFFSQHFGSFIGRSVIFDQRFANFLWAGANDFQFALKEETQAVDRVDIEGIPHGNHQSGLTKTNRNHFEAARLLRADLFNDLRRDHHRGDVDPIHVRLRCQRARDVRVGNDPISNQHIDYAGCPVQARLRAFNLMSRYQADVLQDSEDVVFVLLHGCKDA